MPLPRTNLVSWLLGGVLLVLTAVLLGWALQRPGPPPGAGAAATRPAPQPAAGGLRLGLVPERDIFDQRQRYRYLADYLAARIGRPVELLTLSTYQGVLHDLESGELDVAFVGSMVAVLAHDRLGAQVLAKPVLPGGVNTYRGVLIVPEDSPVRELADLRGQSIAMIRTTTAGNLFPISLLREHGLRPGPAGLVVRWVGTHDDAVEVLAAGQVAAAAVKDLRLEAYEQAHPEARFRRLAVSPPVPNNALIVRRDLDPQIARDLARELLAMDRHPNGRQALALFGAQRFMPCAIEEYRAVYQMVDRLGSAWEDLGVPGPPPVWDRKDLSRQPEE